MRIECPGCQVSARGICDECEARLADRFPPRRKAETLAALAALLAATRPGLGAPGRPPPVDRAALIPQRKREKRQRTPEEQVARKERKRRNKRRRERRRGR